MKTILKTFSMLILFVCSITLISCNNSNKENFEIEKSQKSEQFGLSYLKLVNSVKLSLVDINVSEEEFQDALYTKNLESLKILEDSPTVLEAFKSFQKFKNELKPYVDECTNCNKNFQLENTNNLSSLLYSKDLNTRSRGCNDWSCFGDCMLHCEAFDDGAIEVFDILTHLQCGIACYTQCCPESPKEDGIDGP